MEAIKSMSISYKSGIDTPDFYAKYIYPKLTNFYYNSTPQHTKINSFQTPEIYL